MPTTRQWTDSSETLPATSARHRRKRCRLPRAESCWHAVSFLKRGVFGTRRRRNALLSPNLIRGLSNFLVRPNPVERCELRRRQHLFGLWHDRTPVVSTTGRAFVGHASCVEQLHHLPSLILAQRRGGAIQRAPQLRRH